MNTWFPSPYNALGNWSYVDTAGYANNGMNDDFLLMRYTTDGSLDTHFGERGRVTTNVASGDDRAYTVALAEDEKILVAGTCSNESRGFFALLRYNPDGSLDKTFGDEGKVITEIDRYDDVGRSVALQADGKILIGGSSSNGTDNDFALVRSNRGGSVDTTFGGIGKLTTDFSRNEDGYSVMVQPDGKILLAGSASNGSNNDFALVRYDARGNRDSSFGGRGRVITDFDGADDIGYKIVLQADGNILVAGWSSLDGKRNLALARYNPNGSLDTDFGGMGKVTTSISGNDDANKVCVQGSIGVVARQRKVAFAVEGGPPCNENLSICLQGDFVANIVRTVEVSDDHPLPPKVESRFPLAS